MSAAALFRRELVDSADERVSGNYADVIEFLSPLELPIGRPALLDTFLRAVEEAKKRLPNLVVIESDVVGSFAADRVL